MANNELRLAGRLANYQMFDTDHSQGISPKEASEMNNVDLIHLLKDAVEETAETQTRNGHHDFFSALPPSRSASLFVHPDALSLHSHYISTQMNIEQTAGVMQVLSARKILFKGFSAADAFLTTAMISPAQWPQIFSRLDITQPDYVRSHTSYPLSGKKLPENLVKLDTDGDHALTANDLSDTMILPDRFGAHLIDAASPDSANEAIATFFLMGQLNNLQYGAALADLATHIDSYSQEILLSYLATSDRPRVEEALSQWGSEGHPSEAIAAAMSIAIYSGAPFGLRLQGASSSHSKETGETSKKFSIENIPTVTAADFDKEVRKSSKPVLVVFGVPWCNFCHQSAPVLQSITKEYKSDLKIVTLDAEQESELADEFGVRGYPTFVLIHQGKTTNTVRGFKPETLRETIKENVIKGKDI